MDLKGIMLSEIRQRKTITYMQNLKKTIVWFVYNRKGTDSQIQTSDDQ